MADRKWIPLLQVVQMAILPYIVLPDILAMLEMQTGFRPPGLFPSEWSLSGRSAKS